MARESESDNGCITVKHRFNNREIMLSGLVEGSGASRYTQWWRGGRVVECGGLENRYVGNPGVGGSNPPLSAIRAVSISARRLRRLVSTLWPCGLASQQFSFSWR